MYTQIGEDGLVISLNTICLFDSCKACTLQTVTKQEMRHHMEREHNLVVNRIDPVRDKIKDKLVLAGMRIVRADATKPAAAAVAPAVAVAVTTAGGVASTVSSPSRHQQLPASQQSQRNVQTSKTVTEPAVPSSSSSSSPPKENAATAASASQQQAKIADMTSDVVATAAAVMVSGADVTSTSSSGARYRCEVKDCSHVASNKDDIESHVRAHIDYK